ncbi:MAG: ATP-binding cassette domain-containing protein [bacterium]|nr:ATP-binding cassette domain-containing protein [bacterium]MCM1375035.1 ATP-binding cassette domain-containing protein [Muribaculum sp.]
MTEEILLTAHMEKVILRDFSAGRECDLFHHGIVRDSLSHHNFEFRAGNLYGIIGEFGEGGAALSCALTGNTNYCEGKIFIDGKEETIDHIIKSSWYVGYDIYGARSPFRRKTVKEQIRNGILATHCQKDADAIQEMFRVSEERVGRTIGRVSGERWKASIAIGFAYGKKIFCYPWMNSQDVEHLKEQIKHSVQILIQNGCIVILPTTREENMRKVFSEYTVFHVGTVEWQ